MTALIKDAPAPPSLTQCRTVSTDAILYELMQVRLESTMDRESWLLEKLGSKRHANYMLE